MTEPQNPAGFDPEQRRREIVAYFQAMGREKANEQLGILPYYHAIENAVTKPNQGTFVTRYFRTKWRPALGNEASEIVLAIRFLADKETGETFAGYDTIASVAGLSVRSVERWLSHYPPKNRSKVWLEQWRLLHTFFILGKKKRYPEVMIGSRIERRRTTNIIRIAMDDPVHPDHEGQLYVLAAERILEEEQTSSQTREIIRNRPVDGYGPAPYEVTVEKSPRNRPADGYLAPTSGRSRSLSDRSNANGNNVRVTSRVESDRTSSGFAQDPRVSQLTPEERKKNEALVLELGDWLHRKHGDRESDAHKFAGLHRRAVYLGGPNLVREAMRILDDRIESGKSGRQEWIRDPSAAFWGVVRNLAAEKGISLDPGNELPANRKNEALAGPVETPVVVPEPTRRSVGGVGTPNVPAEHRSPEARARTYANHLFVFRYRNEYERDPSPAEIEQAYQERLAYLTHPPTGNEASHNL